MVGTVNKIIKKKLVVDRYLFYKIHLSLINPIIGLNLTNREIEVLACFMMLDGDLENNQFSTTGREIVRDKLNISFSGLSSYLKILKDKGCIIVNNETQKWEIPNVLKPNKKEQIYAFKLTYEK